MTNAEVAAVFREIAGLLLKKKESWFKVRAYRRAAETIEGLPEPVAVLLAEHRLRQVPGVGEAIEKKVAELVSTGRLEFLERLRAEAAERES